MYRTETLRFDSLEAFVAAALKPAASHRRGRPSHKTTGLFVAGWSGTSNFNAAVELARRGWPEGAAKVKAISAATITKVTSLMDETQILMDVSGLDFDMGAYMSGQPEHWMTEHTETVEGRANRHVRVVFNYGALGDVSGEVKIAKGAAVAALVACLEAAGNRVELIGATLTTDHSAGVLQTYTMLKAADQPLDIDRIAFALVNPAMQRKLHFAIRESLDWFCVGGGDEVGASDDIPIGPERGDIYIGAGRGGVQWTDSTKMQAWVIEQLEKQGVVLQK